MQSFVHHIFEPRFCIETLEWNLVLNLIVRCCLLCSRTQSAKPSTTIVFTCFYTSEKTWLLLKGPPTQTNNKRQRNHQRETGTDFITPGQGCSPPPSTRATNASPVRLTAGTGSHDLATRSQATAHMVFYDFHNLILLPVLASLF